MNIYQLPEGYVGFEHSSVRIQQKKAVVNVVCDEALLRRGQLCPYSVDQQVTTLKIKIHVPLSESPVLLHYEPRVGPLTLEYGHNIKVPTVRLKLNN